MAQLQRVQVLLERAQRHALAQIARREKRSVSEVLREFVNLGLEQRMRQDQHWNEALGRLKQLRISGGKHPLYRGDLVAGARSEREKQIEDAWRKSS